ncbi:MULTISPECIES: DUF2147 domain-containing protein [Marinomonas]|nr:MULTISPECIES: DUF2147 domain-containing protein [Marinomonas]GGN37246.1 hypothetical protein GCM10011350_36240 [Marinomonas arctica]
MINIFALIKVSPIKTMAMSLSKLVTSVGMILSISLIAQPVLANDSSPVGLWKNIDDVNDKPRALIRITESNGTLQGRIEKVFPSPTEAPDPKCEKCEGVNKNAPIIGLEILSGLKQDGDEFVGGQILDPDNGKVYSSKVRLIDGGKKLSVRGYIGVPILGRSQIWERLE